MSSNQPTARAQEPDENLAVSLRGERRGKLRRAALSCASAGWPIFPCVENSKQPACKNGFYDATTDRDTIIAWWTENPDANIGFCPENAGLAVIDEDLAKGGKLNCELGTRTSKTPHGRHHFLAGSLPPTQSKLAPHVDTRGRSSYILLPPSHVVYDDGSEGDYEWECPWPFHDFDCETAPDWVVEKCKVAETPPRKAGDYEADKPEAITVAKPWLATKERPVEGAGSDIACYKAGARLLDLGLQPETALDLLCEWSGFDPDWLWDKIQNAERYRQNEEGCDTPTSTAEAFAGFMEKNNLVVGPWVTEPAPPINDNTVGEDYHRRFRLHDPREYRNRPPLTFYDADKMLPHEQRGAVGVVYGASGHHKTNTLLTMLMQAALDHDEVRVLYVAGEGVDSFGRDRIWAHAAKRGVNDEWIASHFQIVETVPILTDTDDVKALIAEVEASGFRPNVIVVDTLATGTPGTDENSKAMSDILSSNGAAGALRKWFGALVIAVSHVGKEEGRGIRGHSGQYANVDFVLHVAKHGHAIKLECQKMRDGADGGLAYYKAEASPLNGVPIPVRITEGQYRDLTAEHQHESKEKSTLAREAVWNLRRNAPDAVDWPTSEIPTDMLARWIVESRRGERPGETGDKGVREWDSEVLKVKGQLDDGRRHDWGKAISDKQLPDGVEPKKGNEVVHWFVPVGYDL